jgi:hypothetical protein
MQQRRGTRVRKAVDHGDLIDSEVLSDKEDTDPIDPDHYGGRSMFPGNSDDVNAMHEHGDA